MRYVHATEAGKRRAVEAAVKVAVVQMWYQRKLSDIYFDRFLRIPVSIKFQKLWHRQSENHALERNVLLPSFFCHRMRVPL